MANAAANAPFTLGTQNHARRVAAWASEIARAINLNAQDRRIVEDTALAHHFPLDRMDGAALWRMGGELFGLPNIASGGSWLPSASVYEVLQLLRGQRRAADGRERILAGLVEIANFCDEQFEWSPYGSEPEENPLMKALAFGREIGLDEMVLAGLSSLHADAGNNSERALEDLPAYAVVSMRVLRLIANEDPDIRQLETVTACDQALAAQVIGAANSPANSPRHPVTRLGQALSYMGIEQTRKVLAAACAGRVFASSRMRELWKHSLEAATTAEWIARLTEQVCPQEAFIAGLMHDIGRLAFARMSSRLNDSVQRLVERGCERALSERFLLGVDHSAAGARALERWQLPQTLVEAVRHHHSPESGDSLLASVLYLTEYWLGSQEDLASQSRLDYAQRTAGVSTERLFTAPVKPSALWNLAA